MIGTVERADVERLMREAAAQLILPRFRALGSDDVETKTGPDDLVTVADREAEEWLTPRLAALVPGSSVVGEEAVAADPSVLDRLGQAGPSWLVDPIDGTANFVAGKERFGVMIALVRGGITEAGFVYLPVADEMVSAFRGEGAFLDGARLSAPEARPFAEARGDYSRKYVRPGLREQLSAVLEAAGELRQGHCSAYAYTDLARGEIDFVLQYLMSPWDHAPGVLIVEEAGGAARFVASHDRYTPIARSPDPMLAVAAADCWDAYRQVMP